MSASLSAVSEKVSVCSCVSKGRAEKLVHTLAESHACCAAVLLCGALLPGGREGCGGDGAVTAHKGEDISG